MGNNMSVDGTHLMMAQLAELRTNRDDADVSLNCRGEVIMAHSLSLKNRYVPAFSKKIIYLNCQAPS